MKIFFLIAIIFSPLFFATGCGEGVHTEKLTGKYKYVNSGSYSRYIEYNSKRIVDDIVINHAYDDKYIYALRQVSKSYACNPNNPEKISIGTEVTSVFEYWIIETSTEKIYGPLDQLSFIAFITSSAKSDKVPLPTIDEVLKNNAAVYPRAPLDCKDAELIEHSKK